MCCCEKPTINGEHSVVKMTFDTPASVYHVNPPDLGEGETLIYDEPGRCGGSDSHAYHFRVTSERSKVYILVRHGAGDERMEFGWTKTVLGPLAALDSNGRYWLLCAAYHSMSAAKRSARESEAYTWRKAAAEGRLKTRKQPSRGVVKVWIEDPPMFSGVQDAAHS